MQNDTLKLNTQLYFLRATILKLRHTLEQWTMSINPTIPHQRSECSCGASHDTPYQLRTFCIEGIWQPRLSVRCVDAEIRGDMLYCHALCRDVYGLWRRKLLSQWWRNTRSQVQKTGCLNFMRRWTMGVSRNWSSLCGLCGMQDARQFMNPYTKIHTKQYPL